MITKTDCIDTYCITIWIAGDYDDARRSVREFCAREDFCATVTRTTFIYSGAEEQGVAIGCLSYPFNQTDTADMDRQADALARRLLIDLHQRTVMICSDWGTYCLRRNLPAVQVELPHDRKELA